MEHYVALEEWKSSVIWNNFQVILLSEKSKVQNSEYHVQPFVLKG